jgi:steroid delta-isomerase-like uncharacterized protein
MSDLATIYREYISCLNRRDWKSLSRFVSPDVIHNKRQLGLSGYRAMLERDFDDIPDLHFEIQLVVIEASMVAVRLNFNCTPKGSFLGLPVNGRRVSFSENVFYQFRDDKISEVWSVVDKAEIEKQI